MTGIGRPHQGPALQCGVGPTATLTYDSHHDHFLDLVTRSTQVQSNRSSEILPDDYSLNCTLLVKRLLNEKEKHKRKRKRKRNRNRNPQRALTNMGRKGVGLHSQSTIFNSPFKISIALVRAGVLPCETRYAMNYNYHFPGFMWRCNYYFYGH